MNARLIRLLVASLSCFAFAIPTFAATFTTNTVIGPGDATYDGADILVLNSVLTVDGPHTFASLYVLGNSTVTHSAGVNGELRTLLSVINEVLGLTHTNAAALMHLEAAIPSLVVTDPAGSRTYSNGVDYAVNAVNGTTTLERTANSAIPDGGSVHVDYQYVQSAPSGLNLTVTGDVLVTSGGTISATGRGFGGGNGPGLGRSAGSSGSGGGYGGFGGMSSSNAPSGIAYGSPSQPIDKGSGGGLGFGGNGGAGGGAIRLNVGGVLENHGSMVADGAAGLSTRSGGGAGGSLWLSADTITGTGVISANGGNGEPIHGGGGGGGRIAIFFNRTTYTGRVSAHGGSGFFLGGAGTVFTKSSSAATSELVVDNAGRFGLTTPVSSSPAINLVARGGALITVPTAASFGNVLIASNAWLVLSNGFNTALTVSNVIIEAGGGILGDGQGFPAGTGTGAGQSGSTSGGGGAYGGNGSPGASATRGLGGVAYGSFLQPLDRGSGGGTGANRQGGPGGGAIRLNAASLRLDGRLSVNGQTGTSGPGSGAGGGGGGGAGGSIWINVNGAITGTGALYANGASGIEQGGGGGGGRIAIYFKTNLYSGIIQARGGGSGTNFGGAGTVYLKPNDQTPAQLILDNGGPPGVPSTITAQGILDLFLRDGAAASLSVSQLTLRHCLVGSNSLLLAASVPTTINATGDLTVQANGVISADGIGFAAGQGAGAGRGGSYLNFGSVGSGGGFGGGGAPGAGGIPGGGFYGSATAPSDRGSGGGLGTVTSTNGGAGGGALRLMAGGTLRVDGRISADGGRGLSPNTGGGSGGSVWLSAGRFGGTGTISASGGSGSNFGGGGGGGRIAAYFATNEFSGSLLARGAGNGMLFGGAGTIFLQSSNRTVLQLSCDNGGSPATGTALTSLGILPEREATLIVEGGAVVVASSPPTSSLSLASLSVRSNSWLLFSNATLTLSVSSNATVAAGGRIAADATVLQGPGGGSTVNGFGGGGGHAGYGGRSGTGAGGGRAYGTTAPTGAQPFPGSPGGRGAISDFGGLGGGLLSLFVGQTLLVDGSISADGGSSTNANSGGGSGGNILLTVRNLIGSGVISANGGNGNNQGGGGGGGRVAVSYTSNNFAGTMTAYGGNGANIGGAGTVLLTSGQTPGLLRVDNGGRAGTNTILASTINHRLFVQGGAIGEPPPNALQSFSSLVLASNGWLWFSNQVLTITSNAIIHVGSGIRADGAGTTQVLGAGGQGTSGLPGTTGGGGGHGGFGATSAAGAAGGFAFGSITQPATPGGRGGTLTPFNSNTAWGGGAVHLRVLGQLQLDGVISANGSASVVANNGGGAGGSVWLEAGTLSGAGLISASGGAGYGLGGGGGGGRIAIHSGTNMYQGRTTAFGALGGGGFGGAGTVYRRVTLKPAPLDEILVDNGGAFGTNTPLAITLPVALIIQNGAVAQPEGIFPPLNRATLRSGGTLISGLNRPNLELLVQGDLQIEPEGRISVDGQGFSAGTGPGTGQTGSGLGSGAGYGGRGGAAGNNPGGAIYGSAQFPTDRGSGGGAGSGPRYSEGSIGGGALRLSVSGTLTLDGTLSANGTAGWQDNSGGGSGGSIWLSAGALTGRGAITAQGGEGEFFGGGGGGGGRVAIYSVANTYTGLVSVAGADGAAPGVEGSLFLSTNAALGVIAQTPFGVVTNPVSAVDLTFNTSVMAGSLSASDISIVTPNGTLAGGNLTLSTLGPSAFRVSFPLQTVVGAYQILVGPQIQNTFGLAMSQVYTGAFTLSLPTITGTIAGPNGQRLGGVVMHVVGGLQPALTDADGRYVVPVLSGANPVLTPSQAGLVFVPASRSYTNVISAITNENYAGVALAAPAVAAARQGTNLLLGWEGVQDVLYQLEYSTNLTEWHASGATLTGTNGPMKLPAITGGDGQRFFRVRAGN